MADLVARGPGAEYRRRWTIPGEPVTLGRASPPSAWDVPWDQKVSSLHATLTWRGGRLAVRRAPASRNPIYCRGRDQGFEEFLVSVGETFAIGETIFRVEAGEWPAGAGVPEDAQAGRGPDLPQPDAELTCTQEELRRVRYPDAEERIEVLADLPEMIRFSPSDEELEGRVAEVLLRGIPRAEAAAVVRLTGGEAAGEAEVEERVVAARGGGASAFRASRRLVAEVVRRRQSTLHRWDLRDVNSEYTVPLYTAPVAGTDWAICAPLPGDASAGWGLYVAGRLRDPFRPGGVPAEDLFKGDLKFAEVVADIFGALRQVRELGAERVRLQASLDMAREVQAGFFPARLPEVPGYDLAAATRSAEATGGDYYDVIPLASGRLGLVIADVCGHGLGPSLLMASARSVLRGLAAREPAPEALLTDLNRLLFDDLRAKGRLRFITLLYGTLAPAEHLFSYANAGHGPVAFHLPARGGRVPLPADDAARGCPLGILRDAYRPCAPVPLAPGDLLVLGSDGVVETRRGEERFGTDRLVDFLVRHRERPAREILDGVLGETAAFHERARPDDDLTLLIVRRL